MALVKGTKLACRCGNIDGKKQCITECKIPARNSIGYRFITKYTSLEAGCHSCNIETLAGPGRITLANSLKKIWR